MAYSHGWQGKEGALYRQTQLDFINQGKFADAIQMDIDDIQSSFGSKYDSSINEMLDYSYEKGLISEAEREIKWKYVQNNTHHKMKYLIKSYKGINDFIFGSSIENIQKNYNVPFKTVQKKR